MNSEKNEKKNLSRREFLKGAVIAAGTGLIAGCSPKVVSPNQPDATALQATSGPSAGGVMNAATAGQKWSFEIPPDPIPDSQIANTVETEVVIVGSGTSGLVCANAAAEHGAEVVLISASKGNISRGGSIHAMNSSLLRQSKYDLPDTDKLFRKELAAAGNNVDQDKWWKFAKNSEEAMNWLMTKMDQAGLKCVLEYVENDPSDEATYTPVGSHCFTDGKTPVGMGQPLVVDALASQAKEMGVKIVYKTVAEQLLRENNNTGRVTAVIAKGEDGKYTKYLGTKAIVLATGDFSLDTEMLAKYCPSIIPLINTAGDQGYDNAVKFGGIFKGDGQKMGLWIGAAWQKGEPIAAMYMGGNSGPTCAPGVADSGLVVNKRGARYSNEKVVAAYAGTAQMHQPDMEAYSIWGTNYAAAMPRWAVFGMAMGDPLMTTDQVIQSWDKNVEGGIYVKANTIEEVISKLQLPAETIETVKRYNELCKKGVDDDYFKPRDALVAIDTPPYYGGKSMKPDLLTVLGGLRTNIHMQVCDENDNPIPGLYNVGTMVGDYFGVQYNFRISGNNLGANCVTFGYTTGKEIAESIA